MTTTPVRPPTAPSGAGAVPIMGSQKMSRTYYDDGGESRSADRPVPVDQFGTLCGVEFRCRPCDVRTWFVASSVPKNKAPVCDRCEKRMDPLPVAEPPRWPWRAMAVQALPHVRPVWALPVLAAAGWGVADGGIASGWFVAGAPVVGWLARTIAARWALKRELNRPDGWARRVGYMAAASTAWLAVPAASDLSTPVGAAVMWGTLLAGWAIPAGAWWKRRRELQPEPKMVAPKAAAPVGPQVDPDEELVRLIWAARIAAKQGQQVIDPDTRQPTATERAGKLPGTYLENWQRIEGGWSATVVGPIGAYESDQFSASVKNIASSFRMNRSMITVMPDSEDENKAIVMAQRSSPLKDTVRWAGPESIDAEAGTAVVGRYVDGTPLQYELYRPGWGCPHEFLCGTTGSGKSETLSGLLVVDRYASHVGPDGIRRGLVADLLIDPQQGQSYEPFMENLAAPVATSLEEATLLVEAVRAEMLRRNSYLSRKGWRDSNGVLHRAEWTDAKGRTRYGRKWWDPLIDGPLIILNLDEAHEYLGFAAFAKLVVTDARKYRKCGIKFRVATHTPLLTDLGGSMALRDMLTGGFVWMGRTANSLSGPTAFNGRLPVDPRSIPEIPGSGFALGRLSNKPMMSRFMWEPDYYDLVRDGDEQPLGFPAELPAHTLEAFGPEFARWSQALRAGEDWAPNEQLRNRIEVAERTEQTVRSADAVLAALEGSAAPMDMDELDAALEHAGTPFSTRTVRDALKKLRDQGLVFTAKGRHELTPQARAEREESTAAAQEQLALDEGGAW